MPVCTQIHKNGGNIMANCPKCNAHLKLTDWRPECPKCGVNMVYYGMEESLLKDAEKAEAEHAKFQKGLDRFKASCIGGKRQIARLILAIIPVAGLFLPLAKISIAEGPFMAAKDISVNILTLVMDYFMELFDVNLILEGIGSSVLGTPVLMFALSIVLLVLSIVMGILNFGRCFCSSKASSCKKNIIVSVLSVLLLVGACATFSVFGSSINAVFPSMVTASIGFGIFVTMALHVPVIVLNALLVKNPIVVKYKELPDYSAQAEEAAPEAVAAE